MKRKTLVIGLLSLITAGCGYEQAFKKTDAGKIEIKTIPASTKLVAAAEGNYFKRDNDLFMTLFNYIDDNKIKMTVPVEADLNKTTMSFYVGTSVKKNAFAGTEDVRVVNSHEITVASIGGSGAYSEKNLKKSEDKLIEWLAMHPEYTATGKPYAIFWNAPFTPGFLKRHEIHIPVSTTGIINTQIQQENKDMKKLEIGDKAPAFELQDQNGNKVSLYDFKGKKLLIYFYPKADTPGCTKQSCSVSESMTDLNAAGIETVGISPDAPEKQKEFDEKFKLGFPLLADTEKAAAKAYGVWDKKTLYGKINMGIIRSSFLIDEQGIIIGAWYKVSPADTVPNAKTTLGL